MLVPFLKWYENIAAWILWRSPRVGTLFIREFDSPMAAVSHDPKESKEWWLLDDDQTEESQSAAHELERIFHLPAFGEDE